MRVSSATVGGHDLVLIGGALIKVCELCEWLRVGRLVFLRLHWPVLLRFGKRLCSSPNPHLSTEPF